MSLTPLWLNTHWLSIKFFAYGADTLLAGLKSSRKKINIF
jgi:hypothetical protein